MQTSVHWPPLTSTWMRKRNQTRRPTEQLYEVNPTHLPQLRWRLFVGSLDHLKCLATKEVERRLSWPFVVRDERARGPCASRIWSYNLILESNLQILTASIPPSRCFCVFQLLYLSSLTVDSIRVTCRVPEKIHWANRSPQNLQHHCRRQNGQTQTVATLRTKPLYRHPFFVPAPLPSQSLNIK